MATRPNILMFHVDGDFKALLDEIDALTLRDNTIVIFAGDNGRDTSFHGPGNRSAHDPWRGGYFSTYEGNNRTVGMSWCTHGCSTGAHHRS